MPGRPAHATGHLRVLPRKGGDVFYAKLKIPRPDGTVFEPQRRLGRVWAKRSRPPAGYLTRAMAEARLQAILEGDDPLVNIEPPKALRTFQEACDEHLRYLEHDKQRKRSYLNDCRSTVRRALVPAIGADTPVTAITTEDIDELRDALLRQGLQHRTVQKTMILLHGVLGRAKRKRWITENPAENAEKVTIVNSDEFNVLAIEQVHAVARATTDATHAAMIVVAAFTGLRLGELLALRWWHVDFANRILHVRRNLPAGATDEESPKSHRVRSVPLSDQAVIALDELSRREHDTDPDCLVFCDLAGRHASGDAVRDGFYDALIAAGFAHLRWIEPPSEAKPEGVRREDDPMVFHDLRHTFGTMCATAGIDLLKIQKWMGHADLKTTQRYLHYVPQHDDAARLTAAFTAGSVPPGMPRTAHIGV